MSITMRQLSARFEQASGKVTPEASRALRTLAQVGVGYMKSEIQNVHAVDTGTMLNSTTAEPSGPRAYLVGPTVTYAPYVALGTSRMPARPFHVTAARRLRNDVKNLFTAEDLGL